MDFSRKKFCYIIKIMWQPITFKRKTCFPVSLPKNQAQSQCVSAEKPRIVNFTGCMMSSGAAFRARKISILISQ